MATRQDVDIYLNECGGTVRDLFNRAMLGYGEPDKIARVPYDLDQYLYHGAVPDYVAQFLAAKGYITRKGGSRA